MRISDWSSDVCSSDLAVLDEPYLMLGTAITCAETDERAHFLAKPAELSFLRLRTGRPGRFPTPEEAAAFNMTPAEKEFAKTMSASRIVGDPASVVDQVTELVARTGADELIVTTMEIGRANVWTPVTNAHLVCRLMIEK